MAAIHLSLSPKSDVNGMSQVMIRVTLSRGNRPRIKSGIFVKREWFRDGSVVVPRKGRFNILEVREAEQAKTRLTDYVARVAHVCSILGDEANKENISEVLSLAKDKPTKIITASFIDDERQRVQKKQAKNLSFFACMDEYLKEKNFSVSRSKQFRLLMRMLSRYQSFVRMTDKQRSTFEWNIDDTTTETLEDFFDYVRNEKALSIEYKNIFTELLNDYPVELTPKHKSPSISERGENTLKLLQKQLRAFFRWLNERGYTDNQPFRGRTIKAEVYGSPYYLTLEERDKIADFDLSEFPSLAVQRDIFVFQCCVGCRVSDLLKMTPSNVINGCVEYVQQKKLDREAVTISVPLNKRAAAIVEKYAGIDGRLLPFISAQQYNKAIKDILTKCEVKRMVTVLNPTTGKEEQRALNEIASSHLARRTFIGNLYRKVKDPSLIGALSGHSEGSRAFARYREIDESIKRETVKLID